MILELNKLQTQMRKLVPKLQKFVYDIKSCFLEIIKKPQTRIINIFLYNSNYPPASEASREVSSGDLVWSITMTSTMSNPIAPSTYPCSIK